MFFAGRTETTNDKSIFNDWWSRYGREEHPPYSTTEVWMKQEINIHVRNFRLCDKK